MLPNMMSDAGIMVINVRRILGTTQVADHGFVIGPMGEPEAQFALGARRVFIEDNAFNLPMSSLRDYPIRDDRDRILGHEIGHAWTLSPPTPGGQAGLAHTGPLAGCTDTAGLRNLLRPLGLLDREDIDPNNDGVADVFELSTRVDQQRASVPPSCETVNQIALLRANAPKIPGCRLPDMGDAPCVGSGVSLKDSQVDQLEDVSLGALDISITSFGEPSSTGTTILSQELFGDIQNESFISNTLEYWWLLDLDNNRSTGGAPSVLGIPTVFVGAEFVVRVAVSRFIFEIAAAQAQQQPLPIQAIGTAWRFEAGKFIELSDARIKARVLDNRLVADLVKGGSVDVAGRNIVAIELPNDIRGPRSVSHRIQALTRGGPVGSQVIDYLDDRTGEPGQTVNLSPPSYPACTVAPDPASIGATVAVSASRLLPSARIHALLGPAQVATGTTDARGDVRVSFSLPFGVRDGLHLVTVGNVGTAITADCTFDVQLPPECTADATPPTFTFVPPAVTMSSCHAPPIGRARASDACGVLVTNNAPAVFPLGSTIVTWTARDPSGNAVTATQVVTAVLGDDATCCPAGTNVMSGSEKHDVLFGTPGADCILGKGGNDQIFGKGGNDFLSGGGGRDLLNGESGDDYASGGADDDIIFGKDENDTLLGGSGNDKIDGGKGNDSAMGDEGDDHLNGGQDTDSLNGGAGQDLCLAGESRLMCELPREK